jgi:hypothetical protein
MGSWKLAGFIAAIVLLSGGFSRVGKAGGIESLDGMHSLGVPSPGKEPPQAQQPVHPNDAARPPAGTSFGEPLPPHQLTPAPVLPFNPNRSLMPSPGTLPPLPHPPDPAR